MKLTREQAIAEHRKMWNWIADKIEKNRGLLQIYRLKSTYCKKAEFGRVLHSCFLCDYTGIKCRLCPLQWDSEASEYMCEISRDYDTDDTGLCLKCCNAETWQEQVALARQIANLPERTDV